MAAKPDQAQEFLREFSERRGMINKKSIILSTKISGLRSGIPSHVLGSMPRKARRASKFINLEKMVIPIFERVKRLRITYRGLLRTFNEGHPPILLRIDIKTTEQTHRWRNSANTTQDFKVRNFGRSNNGKLGYVDTEVPKYINKESGQG
ncbi:hypothetical protein Tco_1415887 [Tanacetum coccineum]